MKKLFLSIVVLALLCNVVQAQNPVRISTDTLPCGVRQPNYYFTYWYDTACWYQSPDDWIYNFSEGSVYFDETGNRISTNTLQQYASHPIRIRGLWAMVSQDAGYYPVLDSTRLPEYLHLYVRNPKIEVSDYDTTRFLTRIATARWDTAQPKMMCVQKSADGRFPNMYCHVYEALFDTVYTLEGEFWIGASMNSINEDRFAPWYEHFPTRYVSIRSSTRGLELRGNPYAHYSYCRGGGADGPWIGYYQNEDYGPYGAITDGQRYVEVASADSAQGLGLYTAFYLDSTYQTITAVPNRGYHFSHWNDSVTDNPRTIFVTRDTVFTAYFEPTESHNVGVRSSDDSLGYVEMRREFVFQPGDIYSEDSFYVRKSDSVYYEGETAEFRAVALSGAHFVSWDDGVMDNPRSVVVTSDMVYTALFGRDDLGVREAVLAGVKFRLVPNPAREEVRCVTEGEGFVGGVLTVTDVAGREVLRKELSRETRAYTFRVTDFPVGTYFVTLSTAKGSTTQKLVVGD